MARLRSDPAFALRHLPGLIASIGRRIRNRLLLRVRSRHRGLKVPVPGIDVAAALAAGSQHRELRLPAYPTAARARFTGLAADSGSADPVPVNDTEDYLRQHRWSFLLEGLLDGQLEFDAAVLACQNWVDERQERNDAAWEPYSCCERLANLLVYLAAAPAAQGRELPRGLRSFIDESLDWLLLHLEHYGARRTNNHILNNARAMVMGGVATGRPAMALAGMRIFRDWLPQLIGPGGFLREGSSHYQLVVLNWVLDAARFAATQQNARAEDLEYLNGHLAKMIPAATMLCGPGPRLLSLFGDVSPDSSPQISLLRLDRLYVGLWPSPLPESAAAPTSLLIRDGWFRLGRQDSVVLGHFCAGDFPPAFPTHGHADATSFAWLQNGHEIVADLGRWRYTADAISLFQKSAAGHNVPLVNGFAPLCETLVASGQWWPHPYAKAHLTMTPGTDRVELSHDGFSRSTPVTRHTRRISMGAQGVQVMDEFEGTGSVDIQFCWHFGPGFDRYERTPSGAAVQGGRGRVRLDVSGVTGEPEVRTSFARPPAGWASPAYGLAQPALSVHLGWRCRLPATVTTSFAISLSGE